MPRSTDITDFERGRVKELIEDQKLTIAETARILNRSEKLIRNCIARGFEVSPKKRSGRKRKLSDADIRKATRDMSNQQTSFLSTVIRENDFKVSKSTLSRNLTAVPILEYQALLKRPRLTAVHKQRSGAKTTWRMGKSGTGLSFLMRKSSTWMGPMVLHTTGMIFGRSHGSSRSDNRGGGSLMVWFAVSRERKSQIYIVDQTLTAQRYTELLQTMLIPMVQNYPHIGEEKPIFQQDNASAHRAHHTEEWFQQQNIDVLPWPAQSPDLNIMENVFGWLARRVYAGGRQFQTVEQLRDAIQVEWDNLDQALIVALLNSIPHRIFQVIERHGGSADA